MDLLDLVTLIKMIGRNGVHKHRCPECATVWEHPDNVILTTQELHDRAHTCPRCGRHRVIKKYFGRRPATYSQRMEQCERGY